MDPVPTIFISCIPMPCHSGRVVKQPNRFMYLGKFFKAILKEHDTNPIYYDKTISNVDAYLWKETMEVELETL